MGDLPNLLHSNHKQDSHHERNTRHRMDNLRNLPRRNRNANQRPHPLRSRHEIKTGDVPRRQPGFQTPASEVRHLHIPLTKTKQLRRNQMTSTSEYRSIISKDVNGNIRGYVVRVHYIRNTSNQLIEDLRAADDYPIRSFTSIESAKRSTARYIEKVMEG